MLAHNSHMADISLLHGLTTCMCLTAYICHLAVTANWSCCISHITFLCLRTAKCGLWQNRMTVLVSASSSCLRRLPGLEGWHVVKLLLTCCVICMEEKGGKGPGAVSVLKCCSAACVQNWCENRAKYMACISCMLSCCTSAGIGML